MTDCLFCKIAAGEIPADIVFETDDVIAFRDINPVAPVHILIIPKKHIESLAEMTPDDAEIFMDMAFAAQEIAQQEGLADGFRSVINTGEGGGQEVPHLHWHLIGGKKLKWEF